MTVTAKPDVQGLLEQEALACHANLWPTFPSSVTSFRVPDFRDPARASYPSTQYAFGALAATH